MWGNLGASNGDETSVKMRDSVANVTTAADLSTAQKLARECVRKKYKGCLVREPLTSTSLPPVSDTSNTEKGPVEACTLSCVT
jgi:hypothetical protein